MHCVKPMSERVIRIWKKTIGKGLNELKMPEGSIPLSVKIQHFQPHIWFLVPVAGSSGLASSTKEVFNIYGCETGSRYFMNKEDIFLGTTLQKDDSYVLHFFWLGGKSYRDR